MSILLFLQKTVLMLIYFFALTALVPSLYTIYCLISTYLNAEIVWQCLKCCGHFVYTAKMALRYNTTSSYRVGNIIWLSTCFSADNKGEATNTAPSVATPCYLIYSTKNSFKLRNTKMLKLSAMESTGGYLNPNT